MYFRYLTVALEELPVLLLRSQVELVPWKGLADPFHESSKEHEVSKGAEPYQEYRGTFFIHKHLACMEFAHANIQEGYTQVQMQCVPVSGNPKNLLNEQIGY